jgi:hypothetical protein
VMAAGLTVGDFSRAPHLSVKTLRHYHQVGLLEPAVVNPGTQAPAAQARDPAFQDQPMDRLAALTGVALS